MFYDPGVILKPLPFPQFLEQRNGVGIEAMVSSRRWSAFVPREQREGSRTAIAATMAAPVG
jgi:hypothetical protein